MILFSSCSKDDEAEVIPRSRLSKIYAEMLLTDQWISSTPGMRMIADTSLVYLPILQKYGYDRDDYLKSVDTYMDDPERFSRILRESGKILEKRLKVAEERFKEEQRRALLPKIESDFRPEEFFPYLFDEPYVHYYDSLAVEPDSVLMIYRMIDVERSDTTFEGVRMIVKTDSLEVGDVVEKTDSISKTPEKEMLKTASEIIRERRDAAVSKWLLKADKNFTDRK